MTADRICRVHDPDDLVPGRICGRPLPCRDHSSTLCIRGHMLRVDRFGRVVAEVDRGAWVRTTPPAERCPKCGGELEKGTE